MRTEVRFTDAFRAGKIVEQRPRPGADVMPRHTIVLVVARPLPTISNVLGMNLSRARTALYRHGFDVRVRREISSQPVGTILDMSLDGGTSARPGRDVTLVVAKAAPAPPTPASDCQGYSPCIAPGSDVDCSGGSGDGPRYVSGPVCVTGSDPYGLDGYDKRRLGMRVTPRQVIALALAGAIVLAPVVAHAHQQRGVRCVARPGDRVDYTTTTYVDANVTCRNRTNGRVVADVRVRAQNDCSYTVADTEVVLRRGRSTFTIEGLELSNCGAVSVTATHVH